jgi:hypothetical protein
MEGWFSTDQTGWLGRKLRIERNYAAGKKFRKGNFAEKPVSGCAIAIA